MLLEPDFDFVSVRIGNEQLGAARCELSLS